MMECQIAFALGTGVANHARPHQDFNAYECYSNTQSNAFVPFVCIVTVWFDTRFATFSVWMRPAQAWRGSSRKTDWLHSFDYNNNSS
jgi:hypothetical protein